MQRDNTPKIPADITEIVRLALLEDIGDGDITAALIPATAQVTAKIFCKESAVLCGRPWVAAALSLVDQDMRLNWHHSEGDEIQTGEMIVTLSGAARSILTGERTALNFLQTLSGTATTCRHYANLVAHTKVKLLDTRKTLPGLRTAQKYAVRIGGCHNHRMGLFDAFLIKENHIAACGGITEAIGSARAFEPQKLVEIEVRNLQQLELAITAKADVVMLDNFSLQEIAAAVSLNNGQLRLEASGGIDTVSLVKVAESGVDYVSIGALTKHCKAIDFTLLID